MREIFLVKPFGFCSGLKRTLNIVKTARKKYKNIYTLGELLHNPVVVRDLNQAGVIPKSFSEVSKLKKTDSTVIIIRAHGVRNSILKRLQNFGINILDATCPYVQRVCKIAENLKKEKYWIVIVGDKKHPEVKAIVSYAPKKVVYFEELLNNSKLRNRLNNQRIGVIAQTTIALSTFREAVRNMMTLDFKELRIYQTICSEVLKRQSATAALAKFVDGMVVIGGRNSANTKRLKEISEALGRECFWLSELNELPKLKKFCQENKWHKIGITSGTSTPEELVLEVVKNLKKEE